MLTYTILQHFYPLHSKILTLTWLGITAYMPCMLSDAGASPTTSECGASTNAFWHMINFLKVLKFDIPNINETIKKGRTCIL
jgi:hypothetical protein